MDALPPAAATTSGSAALITGAGTEVLEETLPASMVTLKVVTLPGASTMLEAISTSFSTL